jgi:ferric-dicitrate binding protein FerR (iron transport regulator)
MEPTDWDSAWEEAPLKMDKTLQRKIFKQVKEEIGWKRQRSLPFGRIAAAVLLMLSVGLSVYLYQRQARPLMHDMVVQVERGQRVHVILPDGSRVAVNSGSELSYGDGFDQKDRVLSLKGEAYFEVAHDKKRPFIVKAGGLAVRAVGTCFDVKSYAGDAEASAVLISGRVEVSTDKECLSLLPDERVSLNKRSGEMTKSRVDNASSYADWRHDSLTFNGDTFEEIARTLERQYNIRITFASEALKKYRFRGTSPDNSLENILQVLSLASPLSYELRDSVVILREDKARSAYYEHTLK